MKINLDELPNLRERVLFIGVYLFVGVLFFKYFNAPLTQKIDEVRTKLQFLTTEKEVLINYAVATPSLENRTAAPPRKSIKMKILAGDIQEGYEDLMDLLAQLTKPSFLGGVKVLNMSHLAPVSDQGYSKTSFVLNIRGRFPDIMRYVERLEKFPALVALDHVSLNVAEGQPQEVESELKGTFYLMGGHFSSDTAQKGSQGAAPPVGGAP